MVAIAATGLMHDNSTKAQNANTTMTTPSGWVAIKNPTTAATMNHTEVVLTRRN